MQSGGKTDGGNIPPPGPSGVGGFGFQQASFVEVRIVAEKTESRNPGPFNVEVAVECFAKSSV